MLAYDTPSFLPGDFDDNVVSGGAMLREHELRRHIVSEMHLRRWPKLTTPLQIIQILRLVDSKVRDAEFEAVLAPPAGGRIEAAGKRHVSGTLEGDIAFTWERHSEASSITLFAEPASHAALASAIEWAESLPGDALRATRLTLVQDEDTAEAMMADMAFVPNELVSCHVAGQARIWSDFLIGADGYGRLLVAANGLAGSDLTRVVQRLQELGNYRNLALLGLPVAQASWPLLDAAEQHLRRLAENIVRSDVRDDALMDQLSSLSLEIATIASSANYRMSATDAYAQLVDERLNDLAPTAIAGFPSLLDFTQRRLLPGVRTCAAFTKRERQVTARAAQFTALLRTRIETRIENQNGALLASLERSAKMQLRMQQLVEGLSVVAISYYAISLIGHVLEGAETFLHGFNPHLAVAIVTPAVLVATWLGLHHLKRGVLGHHPDLPG